MRKYFFIWLFYFPLIIQAQKNKIDKVKFFEEEKILKATLVSNTTKMLNGKMKEGDSIPSSCIFNFDDSTNAPHNVVVSVRGNFRRKNCIIPPLRLNFKMGNSIYSSLGSLKLVSPCKPAEQYNQYLLIEYLIYKMYNLFTEKSFRVRLLELTYKDSSGKRKEFTQNAFLIEDTKDMAKRNNMVEWKKWKVGTEQTDYDQMTLLGVFQFMIGNTDWSVPVTHNIRLIYNKETQNDYPFAVPYDFDYCGLVNADYAVPYELLNLENIRQRLYRGFPRAMEDLTKVFAVFKEKREKIYSLINDFDLLDKVTKKDMIQYIESFYDIIDRPNEVKSIFITNARKDR